MCKSVNIFSFSVLPMLSRGFKAAKSQIQFASKDGVYRVISLKGSLSPRVLPNGTKAIIKVHKPRYRWGVPKMRTTLDAELFIVASQIDIIFRAYNLTPPPPVKNHHSPN